MKKFGIVITFPAFMGFIHPATKTVVVEAENEKTAIEFALAKHDKFNRSLNCKVIDSWN